jgi:hypothetical protein
LNGPALGVLARIDFEKAGSVEAAHEAIFPPNDAEFAVVGALEGLAVP